jgi:hypothetical protein
MNDSQDSIESHPRDKYKYQNKSMIVEERPMDKGTKESKMRFKSLLEDDEDDDEEPLKPMHPALVGR